MNFFEDSSLFRAGQLEERLRLCSLIDIRIDELRNQSTRLGVRDRCEELLCIRQALNDRQ